MPSWQELTPPDWNEADSFRETTLIYIASPEDREALRQVGRLVYDLATEAGSGPADPSTTRAELHAALADLRSLQGFLATILRESEESSLDAEEQALSVFAGQQAARVGAIADAIEGRLS